MIPKFIIPIPQEVQDQMFSEHEDEYLQQANEDGYTTWEAYCDEEYS